MISRPPNIRARGRFAWAQRTPVLPSYKRQRAALETVVKKGSFLAFCVLTGLFYGLAFAILPPQLSIYLGGPLLALLLLIIWALPDVGVGPSKLLLKIFFTYLIVLPLWPNYLAVQIPGLPWISIRRLTSFPMALVLLVCLSVSSRFREKFSEVLTAAKPLTYMMLGLSVVQLVTVFWSTIPFYSLNVTVNYWFGVTAAFFVAAWALSDSDRAERFINWTLAAVAVLCVIGLLEARKRGILWADYIPSFLKVDDEAVLRTLEGKARDGRYRVTTTFSVSLSMAEYLAIVVPFVIHKVMRSRRLEHVVVWGAFDLLLLVTIYSTQSRLGILGWFVAHGYYVCVWAVVRWRKVKSDIIAPAIALLYPIGLALFFFAMFTVPAVRNRTIGGGSSGISDQGRRDQYALLWPKLFHNPFGYGSGRSGEVLGYRQPGGLLTVDSYVITIFLEYGIIGFCFYFGALIYGVYELTRISLGSDLTRTNLALPVATAFVVVLEVKLVLSQPDNHPFIAMLMGLAAAIIWNSRQSTISGKGDERKPTSP